MQTKTFNNNVFVKGYAAVGSVMEKQGSYGGYFDVIFEDPLAGEKTWEKAESRFQKTAVDEALKKSRLSASEIDNVFAGDLLNQCTGSSFAARKSAIPFIGVYGACSTMALSTGLAASFISSGISKNVVAATSSHFCSAERQYRFPLEYGGQRTTSAQWTATAAGALVLSSEPSEIMVQSATFGKIVDLGIKDATNMGAAMAPAAADTIAAYLKDTVTKPSDYDRIFTGDLGSVGTELLYELLDKENLDIKDYHSDCGLMLYDRSKQDVHAGASGCGCSASILCGYILNEMKKGGFKNILFCATGALLSPISTNQGESIPSIAHIINFKRVK